MARVVGFLGFLFLITACSAGNISDDHTSSQSQENSSGNGDTMRTLTMDEAARRAEQHIHGAVSALPVEPSLSALDDSSTKCQDPSDNGPPGRYEIRKSYRLDGIPEEQNSEMINTLYRHWDDKNYQILDDYRSDDDMFISVEHEGDAFRMSVIQNDAGQIVLGASSPCVWPDGVPPSSVEQ